MEVTLSVNLGLGHPKAELHVRSAFAEFLAGLPARVAGVSILGEGAEDEQVPRRSDAEGAGPKSGKRGGAKGLSSGLRGEAWIPGGSTAG